MTSEFDPVADMIDWESRLAQSVAQTLADRERRRTERLEFKRRRDVGLRRRYAAKTARNREANSDDNVVR